MSKQLMSVKEVAEVFGVGETTIWAWTRSNTQFPQPQKIGRTTRWHRDDVESYICSVFGKEA